MYNMNIIRIPSFNDSRKTIFLREDGSFIGEGHSWVYDLNIIGDVIGPNGKIEEFVNCDLYGTSTLIMEEKIGYKWTINKNDKFSMNAKIIKNVRRIVMVDGKVDRIILWNKDENGNLHCERIA